jgi:hypothetical protein
MRFVDRQGRVDKFRQAQAAAQAKAGTSKKKSKKAEKADTQTFKDILKSQKQTIAE